MTKTAAADVASSPASDVQNQKNPASLKSLLRNLGPGLITGASDDDPSGIATYSQTGAQFGMSMLWTMLFSYPLMESVQEISARIGRVTGHGLAGNMRRYYPAWLMYILVGLMLVANIANLGADIGAMGSALKLLIGGSALLWAAAFALLSLGLQVFVPYTKYARILKWFTLALLAYIGVIFSVHINWGQVARSTFIPSISFKTAYLTTFIAVLGTTISPYLFFWQASEEAEEEKVTPGDKPLKTAPSQAPAQLHRIKIDTAVGMAVSNLVAFFIILTAAVTLHQKGVTDINTAQDAAKALEPIAGKFAFFLFAAGIIGTGLLAVPVLAGSAAYAVGEAMKWPIGLERKLGKAKGFYGVLAVSTLLGLALNFTQIDPVKALFWSAVINGVVAGPVMIMLMLMSNNPKVMGEFTVPKRLQITGWIATVVMLLAAVGMFATWGK